jgi:hypothetical protein
LEIKLSKQAAELFLGLFFDSEHGGSTILQNISKLQTNLHGVTFQKTILFINYKFKVVISRRVRQVEHAA